MKTSIIVPLWNHLDDLTIPFIKQLLPTEGDWELVLVDNGSHDGTKKYLKDLSKKDKRVKAVISKKNLGFGGGNNLGYREATGERICFLSNDVIIGSHNWLEVLNQYLDRNPKRLLGPQLVSTNQLTAIDNLPTPYIAGWCMFSDKSLFDKLAPQVFDEDFDTAYFEDVWLSVRAQDFGYHLLEVPVDLQHMGSKSSDQINIPKTTKKNQYTFKNKMMAKILKQNKQKRIVFFAGNIPYPFIDEDFEGRGVGGAESSLILLSREFAADGWRVEVYNKTDISGVFNGVRYHSAAEFIPSTYMDVFVLFREWHPVLDVVNSNLRLFWSCDQYTDMPGIWNTKIFPNVDRTIAISPYHKKYLEENYTSKRKVKYIELGVNWKDYKKPVKKVPGRAIYCSVPMRGLELLAKYVPEIKARVSNFQLIITSDYRLWGLLEPKNEGYINLFKNMSYVKFVSKVSREKLVHYQKTSEVMAYPCTYAECFCVSALECMAAGAVPVTTTMGALPTTVGASGVLLSNSELDSNFVDLVVDLFKDKNKRLRLTTQGKKRAESRSWDKVCQEWQMLIKQELPMARRKAKKGRVKSKPVTAVEMELPKFSMLRFTKPVEFAINGRMFASKPQSKDNQIFYQVEVPFDMASGALTIVSEAYGPDVILS